jgi:diaminopimelate decarboxylase
MKAGFEREGPALLCDGVPLGELADRFGTPLYVYSRELIASSYRRYDRAFLPVPHTICYALKANSTGALLKVLSALGAGADVVSGGELSAALRAGFPPGRIVFAGVGKTDAELRQGLEAGVGLVNVESGDEIERLHRLATERGSTARIALRVNPSIDPLSHPHIATGLGESKFGIGIETVPALVERCRSLAGVRLVGVQCHIGSQVRDLGRLEAAARAAADLSRRLLASGVPLEVIDLGGGLGIDYEGDGGSDPEGLAARVLPALEGLPLALLLEPGRSLVGSAGVLLTRIVGRKENGGRRFVIVDAGMNDLLRPALYDAYHRVEPVVSRGAPPRKVDVVGPVCETADFLARDRLLEDLPEGDLLAVRDAGAYGFAMSSRYNLRPRPAEVLVEPSGPRLIRRRETFADLVATEES